ncbi:MAG: NAD(P)-binding domain-containing protein [Bacteroidales bacterium]|nr:NAD(P)-binding domain-containing protein [Bacteroidales bacterium]
MEHPRKIGVLGGGSWATAIVKLLLNNCDSINWYVRNPTNIEKIKKFKHNPSYLSSVYIDTQRVLFFDNLTKAIEESDILVVAIPASFIEDAFKQNEAGLTDKFIFSAVKGIVPQHNLTITEFFNKLYNIPFSRLGIISGPCHAEEIALERLSYLTVSSKNKSDAAYLADRIRCHYVHAKISDDIYGTEYAAVLKNIIAIGAGICHGLGYGDNFQAVLISNAIQEIKRFLDRTYRSKRRINSSPYLGDLLVTSYSQFSRNRTFGTMIGKGYSVKSALLEMNMVAEGVNAVGCIRQINEQFKVRMPITDAVYNILVNKVSAPLEIKLLTEKLK